MPASLTEFLAARRDSPPRLQSLACALYGKAPMIAATGAWAAIFGAWWRWQRRSDRRYRRLWEIEDHLLLERFTPESRAQVLRGRQAARERLRPAEEILRGEERRGARRR
jgi:membrane associated rhomboid family serine protease